jgi:tetratricopeptide (TPR) repeat protein
MRPTTPEALAETNPQKAGRNLGANIVLTGSMQKAGDRLRVAYEVVDLAQGTSHPGDLIEGSASDLFGIQDKLADSIAASLQLGAPIFRPAPDSGVSQTRYLEALGHLRRYDQETSVDSAIRILEELAAQSSSASVQAALARAYLAKFQLTHDAKWANPATAAGERAIAADPQNPDVHVTLGELRRLRGALDDALKEYKAALAQQPNNADAILGIAETYKAAGKLAEAEAAYKKSIDLQPNYWSGYNKLGVFYASYGRLAESVPMFQKVIALVPDNQRAYNNLGGIYEQMGRYDDAVALFQKNIAAKPTDQGYSNLGTCYYYMGKYGEAAAAFERAATMTPTKSIYWSNLGDAYRWVPSQEAKSAHAYDEAIALCRRDLHLNESDAVTRARLAACLAKRGDAQSAKREMEHALETDPSNRRLMYMAAVVANVDGLDAEAVRWLSKAIEHGYDRSEIQRDPEFAVLRNSDIYKRTFAVRVQ